MILKEVDYTEDEEIRYRFIFGPNAYYYTGRELWRIVERYRLIEEMTKRDLNVL